MEYDNKDGTLTTEYAKQYYRESLDGLFTAVREYHQKHSKGAGGQAFCSCGEPSGGSRACNAITTLRYLAMNITQGHEPTEQEKIFLEMFAYGI